MDLMAITPHIKDLENFLTNCHRRRYPNRSTIIYEGDTCNTLYYIIEGSVSVVLEDDDGREVVIAYLNPGDFFGEMGLFEQKESQRLVSRTHGLRDCRNQLRELQQLHPYTSRNRLHDRQADGTPPAQYHAQGGRSGFL